MKTRKYFVKSCHFLVFSGNVCSERYFSKAVLVHEARLAVVSIALTKPTKKEKFFLRCRAITNH